MCDLESVMCHVYIDCFFLDHSLMMAALVKLASQYVPVIILL